MDHGPYAFLYEATDIPPGMTIAEYRADRVARGHPGSRSPRRAGSAISLIGRCRAALAARHCAPQLLSMPRRRMAVAQQTSAVAHHADSSARERDGWITVAAVMLILASIVTTIGGIAAISASSFYVADARYILGDLNTWGWVLVGLGVLQAVVALGVLAGNRVARWAGVVITALNAIAQLVFVPAYPSWSLSVLAMTSSHLRARRIRRPGLV